MPDCVVASSGNVISPPHSESDEPRHPAKLEQQTPAAVGLFLTPVSLLQHACSPGAGMRSETSPVRKIREDPYACDL